MKKNLFVLLMAIMMVVSMVGCAKEEATTEAAETTTEATAEVKEEATTEVKEEAPAEVKEEEAMKLEGTVIIDGSGTVYPLMANIAEEYMTTMQEDVSVQVGRAGSSAGLKKFIPGELDFADASRKIKDEEVQGLKDNGLEFGVDVYEFKLAYDGLTMVINKENTWAVEMTKDEIIKMYLSGSYNAEDMVKWSDIRADWPAEEVKFYGPNENHGTYEFFYENILGKADMVKSANLQQEYSTLVDLVSKDKNAIAFFGYGYYAANTDKLVAVKIDFGSGAVAPSAETIGEDLAYAGFTRPVFTYLNVKYALEKPEVLDFAKYVVSLEGASRLASANGFAPLPDSVYEEYQKQLDALK